MPALAPAIRLSRHRSALDEDGLLLRRAAKGDDSAFEAFHDRHVDALLRYCQHLLGSRHEAEDAVQQSFFNAYRHITAGNFPLKPRPWLYAIARNQALSTIRSRREHPAELVEPATPALSEEVERRDELRELVHDLNRLPEDQRSAIILFELADLPQAEIAEVMDREPEQVKSLVYQARSTLMARRTARALPCKRVQEQLAVAKRGELNSRMLRNHLDGCAECQRYLEDQRRHRRGLALLFPAAPALAASSGKGGAAVAAGAKARHAKWGSHTAAAATAATVAAGAIAATLTLNPGGSDHRQSEAAPPTASRSLPAVVAPAPTHGAKRSAPRRHSHRAPPKPASAPPPRPAARLTVPVGAPSPPRQAPAPTQSPPPSPPPQSPPAHPQTPPSQPEPPAPPPAATTASPPAGVPAPTVVASPPPAAPPPPVRTNNGNHYGQVRHPNDGNHYGQGPGA